MGRLYGVGTEKDREAEAKLAEEKKSKQGFQKKIETIIAVSAVGLGLIVAGVNIVSASMLSDEAEGYKQQQAVLANELAKYQETNPSGDTNVEVIQAQLYSAKEAGSRVCELQNQFWTSKVGTTEDDTIVEEFRKYFVSTNENSTRNPWILLKQTDLPADFITSPGFERPLWIFDSTYDMAADEGKVPVVWECYDQSDTEHKHLIAAVYATYDANSNTFVDASKIETAYGSWYLQTMANAQEVDETVPGETDQSADPTETTDRVDGILGAVGDPTESTADEPHEGDTVPEATTPSETTTEPSSETAEATEATAG